jgi:hypothetical protein
MPARPFSPAAMRRLTLGKAALALPFLALAGCGGPIGPQTENLTDRLEVFADECGFAVSLPMERGAFDALLAENNADFYSTENPADGHSGDNVFPLNETPEHPHGEIVEAVVVMCEGDDGRVLWGRSPRHAFYIDRAGVVVHLEDHSLYTG